jgi:hypothetical protein
MYSPKRTSFIHTLLSNSQANDINESAKEWRITKIGYSERYAPCECCGTPIKNHAIIENKTTRATLTIGLTCLENLRCTQEGLELPSFKEYINRSKNMLEGKIKQFYEDTLVDIKSWKNWFLSLEDIPDDLKEGFAQLKYWGILSDDLIDKFIEYHDDNRLFPREVLISPSTYFYLTKCLSIDVPDYLTISQAKQYLKMAGSEKCPQCEQLVEFIEIHMVEKHDYQKCPECDEIYKPTKIGKHLIEVHKYRRCPICHQPFKEFYINTHLIQQHNWCECPECGISVSCKKLIKHLKEEHYTKMNWEETMKLLVYSELVKNMKLKYTKHN